MSRLLLIRHGQTYSNLSHSLDTQLPGASLTDLGWHQAHAAGQRLAGEVGETGTGASDVGAPGLYLVSSQALRARQTAAGIATGGAASGLVLGETGPSSDFAGALAQLAGLDVTGGLEHGEVAGPAASATASAPAALGGRSGQDAPVAGVPAPTLPLVMPGAVPGISEIPAGTWEMRSDDEAQENYHRVFGQWLGGALDLAVPGALAGRDVVDRYLTALLPMLGVAQRTGSDLAVVSHGAVIRLIAGFLGRVDPDYAVRTLLPNTSRVELEVPELAVLPTLPTSDAPTVDTAAVLEGWRVTDWAGHGEPPQKA
ncbi:MAG TPA: histidine phosphatase family protein [Corynebacterium nuruki]|uniref:Histidine phosphatase family protein n=1 Tax=Corynebacterium nuruki TaxID=1032851 RepID=A0A3D4SYJ7_9CORY|nr:histidine phosphatase family protein [Corynebacterium nuruki]